MRGAPLVALLSVLLLTPAAQAASRAPADAAAARPAERSQAVAARPAAKASPGPLFGWRIVLDPGHGRDPRTGAYTGARGVNGVYEDVNVLDIAERLAVLLRAQGASVFLTRGAYDPGPPPVEGLIRRVALARRLKADLYVSIHQNDGSAADTGVSTYYATPASLALARAVEASLVAGTGLRNDGVVRRGFYVLRETPMPSVLVEGGFLSNPREARTISSPAFHEEEAKALDAALLAYAKAHPRPAGAVGGTPRLAAAATVRRLCGLPTSGRTLDLVATAYGPTLQDNYPYGPVDAFGDPLKPGDVAVDPHLIPLGTHLWVSGYRSPYLPAGGFCAVARDTGGAIKGRRIDIFLDGTEAQVNSFGIQRVTAVILE